MKEAILGKKIGMIRVLDTNRRVVPVTVVGAGPCVVVQKKAVEKNGYEAVQVGFGDVRERLVNKSKKGRYAKTGVSLERRLREFRLEDCSTCEVGQGIKADLSETGDKIDVSGASRGEEFRDVIKKWDANGGPMTHGSKFHRAVGSINTSSDPSRTFKNKNMPGHMGAVNTTVLNLEVIKAIAEKNPILIEGGIPGPNRGTVVIRNAVRA